MNRVVHFLRAESKTLAGIGVLLVVVAWVWTGTPPAKPRPVTLPTVVPGEHLAGLKVGSGEQAVRASLGEPSQKRALPLAGVEAWLYPEHALQVDMAQGAVLAVRARVSDATIEAEDALVAQGLLMDASIKTHPNLTAINGKLSDWVRLEKALKLENPRSFKFDKLAWRVFPGLVLVVYNHDPKQKPKLVEVIITASPRVPEAWEMRR